MKRWWWWWCLMCFYHRSFRAHILFSLADVQLCFCIVNHLLFSLHVWFYALFSCITPESGSQKPFTWFLLNQITPSISIIFHSKTMMFYECFYSELWYALWSQWRIKQMNIFFILWRWNVVLKRFFSVLYSQALESVQISVVFSHNRGKVTVMVFWWKTLSL